MYNTTGFDEYAKEYDPWFHDHPSVYESELEAVKQLLPGDGEGLEIGVGNKCVTDYACGELNEVQYSERGSYNAE